MSDAAIAAGMARDRRQPPEIIHSMRHSGPTGAIGRIFWRFRIDRDALAAAASHLTSHGASP